MSWQKAVLNKYKETYPKDSIREIARKTGIHYSRTCRLFQGSEMKLSEFQAFNKALSNNNQSIDYAIKLFNECLVSLPSKKINYIISLLERYILNHQITHKAIIENFNFISDRSLV